jgi:hypothetical protein
MIKIFYKFIEDGRIHTWVFINATLVDEFITEEKSEQLTKWANIISRADTKEIQYLEQDNIVIMIAPFYEEENENNLL